ncbi:MAG: HlyD family secretion protein [Polyangiaceae bacterium]
MSGEASETVKEPVHPAGAEREAPKPPRKRRTWIVAVLVAIVGGAGAFWWFQHHGLESTDDAQIDADVVAVPSRAAGYVTAIHFTDNQRVEAGDLLVELDSRAAEGRVAQAQAELDAARASSEAAAATARLTESNARAGKDVAKAGLTGASIAVTSTYNQITEAEANAAAVRANRDKAKTDLDRTQALVSAGALPGSQLDSAKSAYDSQQALLEQAEARVVTLRSNGSQAQAKVTEASARLGQADTVDAQIAEAQARANAALARVATAQAALDLAKLDLSFTKIYAPRAGIVSKRSVSVGQMVGVGTPVLMIVPQDDVWVTANLKETQLANVRVGQPVTLQVDAYGRSLHGTVESFSGATGARFALLPPDNATGNYTKVVQRVPVRIHIDSPPADVPLLPGLSVELTIDTRHSVDGAAAARAPAARAPESPPGASAQ